jgi:hypothetical protein
MDTLNEREYPQIIERIFQEYIDFFGTDNDIKMEMVSDRQHNRYLIVEKGWQNGYRIYGVFCQIDIVDDKLWIEHDGSEEGIANELAIAGVPKDRIVLAYRSVADRQVTEFAVY